MTHTSHDLIHALHENKSVHGCHSQRTLRSHATRIGPVVFRTSRSSIDWKVAIDVKVSPTKTGTQCPQLKLSDYRRRLPALLRRRNEGERARRLRSILTRWTSSSLTSCLSSFFSSFLFSFLSSFFGSTAAP